MFTSSSTHILCWEDSWKQGPVSHSLPAPHKYTGCAKSRSPHVTAPDTTEAADREQPPPSLVSSSSPGYPSPSMGLAPSFFIFILPPLLFTLFNFSHVLISSRGGGRASNTGDLQTFGRMVKS